MQPLLELNNIVKTFGEHRAVDNVDLTLEPGERTVIIGRPAPGSPPCFAPSTFWKPSTPAPSASKGKRSATGR